MIVQPTCSQIEIATDCSGDVEIVQERAWNEDCETTIVISRQNAGLAARAILDAAGLSDVQFYIQKPGGLCWDYDPLEDIETPESKPANAELGLSDAAASFGSSGCGSAFAERKDRRARIKAALRDDPSRSNRAIAKELGVDHKTVGKVRGELSGEFPAPAGEPDKEDAPLLAAE